jgi:hypothetical protein
MKAPQATREKELETVLVLCVAAVVAFFATKMQHTYWLKLSVVLGIIGLFVKPVAAKISWAWLKLGELMGAVTGKIILSIVFFIFLFPMALLSRLFSGGKDSLQLKKKASESYYFDRNHTYTPEDLGKTW